MREVPVSAIAWHPLVHAIEAPFPATWICPSLNILESTRWWSIPSHFTYRVHFELPVSLSGDRSPVDRWNVSSLVDAAEGYLSTDRGVRITVRVSLEITVTVYFFLWSEASERRDCEPTDWARTQKQVMGPSSAQLACGIRELRQEQQSKTFGFSQQKKYYNKSDHLH